MGEERLGAVASLDETQMLDLTGKEFQRERALLVGGNFGKCLAPAGGRTNLVANRNLSSQRKN